MELEKQIEETMKKAFCDLIDERIQTDKPDIDWLINLYIEIKNRLLSFLRKDSKTYKTLDNDLDTKLFKQMVENNVFDTNSFIKLVDTVYYWIEYLQAPIRDVETNESKKKVLKSDSSKFISTFITEVHVCIDNIEQDIKEFYKNNI
jgi:heme oxygenase